jgi:hypothetical protein
MVIIARPEIKRVGHVELAAHWLDARMLLSLCTRSIWPARFNGIEETPRCSQTLHRPLSQHWISL